ncbi:hypothetical protein [Thermithiobacillus plumbiphilus]|uniref:DUF3168 domain-containing protein n=1 Tax=Thermithiobacillus plumbiphilus TaxID=1729899 RepID=A0ABU9D8P8_9PROT
MTSSVRERLVRAVVARIGPAIAPTPLHRQPTVPLSREASPALLLFIEGDQVLAQANDRLDRALTLRLVALAREGDAFDVADALIVAAHGALMAEPSLGGLALGVREIDCEWDTEDADSQALAVPARYEIRYRTLASDLTRQG